MAGPVFTYKVASKLPRRRNKYHERTSIWCHTECPKNCAWQIWFPLIDRNPQTFVDTVSCWLRRLWSYRGYQEKDCRTYAGDRSDSMQSSPTYQKLVSLWRLAVYARCKQSFVRWQNHDERETND